MLKKFFTWSIRFTIIAVIIWFFLWAGSSMNIIGGLQAVFIVLVLWVLEISLSFDNAVVNATVLEQMEPKWQKRFLTRWIAIAVFGMRIIFPLVIVAIVGQINPIAALTLAISDPIQYANLLTSSHIVIAWFGGAFLFMVAIKFFLDIEKKSHWLWPIEKFLYKIGELESAEIIVGLIVVFFVSRLLHWGEMIQFLSSAIRGIIIYSIVDSFAEFLKKRQKSMRVIAKAGLSLFIYLEVLDASFSFDGVIGAFALSKNIFIIALWLGIWAMFVRSLTILLVKKGTLTKYKYLEHGAFRAILSLAIIMFISTTHHVPEVLTGLLGAGIIGIAFRSSVRANKKLAINWKKE